MPDPLVAALIAHCDSVFAGPNGDYAAVLEALAGVSAAQALWRPAPALNSIWRIVEHLTASKAWLIEMFAHRQPASPVWIEPAGGEAAWQAALERLKEAHRRLQEALAEATQKLIVRPPYSYCRNPMALGTIIAYLGVSVIAGSPGAALLVLLSAAVLLTYIKVVEEREMVARFGEEYLAYRRRVPFIIPRLRTGRGT